jgi:hypothetical protein
VPLHRHPELDFALVRFRLSQLLLVSNDEFTAIVERRKQKVAGHYQLGKNRWEWALQSQFLPLSHVRDSSLILYLRRDAQEAYIVRNVVM